MQGYVPLYRNIENSSIWGNPSLLKLYIHCLIKASHQPIEVMIGLQTISLEKNQFVTGQFQLAEEYNRGAKGKDVVNPRTLWRWMKALERANFLSIKSTKKYSVVTVLKTKSFQWDVNEMSNSSQENDNIMPSEYQANDHIKSTYKKEKKEENEKNDENDKKEEKHTTANHLQSTPLLSEKFYQSFNSMPKDKEFREISSFLNNGLEEELVFLAFEKAKDKNKPFIYTKRILQNWSKKGIKNLEQAEEESKNFKKNGMEDKIIAGQHGRLSLKTSGGRGVRRGRSGRLFERDYQCGEGNAEELL